MLCFLIMYTMYVYKMYVIVVKMDFVFPYWNIMLVFFLERLMHYRKRLVVVSVNITHIHKYL